MEISILGIGAQTPIGRSALAAAAAVRCGLSAYDEHPYQVDGEGEPMVVVRADWLDESAPLVERIASLAVDAAEEAVAQATPSGRDRMPGTWSTYLGLSGDNLHDDVQRRALESFWKKTGKDWSVAPLRTVYEGHSAGLLALENATQDLLAGRAEICLVGGADSYIDPWRLEMLEAAELLRTETNRWGFTPGEGAAFCVLAKSSFAQAHGLESLGEIAAIETSAESNLQGTETVCVGQGLTDALRGVLSAAEDPVSDVYCDLNGQTYRADEYAFTVCRTSNRFRDAGDFIAAADCWGDVGAASGPLALVLAVAAGTRNYAHGKLSLLWTSSCQLAQRAAALLRTA